jgi:hypothetical protein
LRYAFLANAGAYLVAVMLTAVPVRGVARSESSEQAAGVHT